MPDYCFRIRFYYYTDLRHEDTVNAKSEATALAIALERMNEDKPWSANGQEFRIEIDCLGRI